VSACGRSLRAQPWPVRGVSFAWRLSGSYESVPRCEQRVLCPSANPTGGSCGSLRENPSGGKVSSVYGNRVMMPGRGGAVDPHIAMLHIEQKSFGEPIRHWSDWSNGTSCSGRARPAWMGAEERTAGSVRMTRYWPAWRSRPEIPKMATPLHLGEWKCLTPISDEEPTVMFAADVDRRAILTPRCSLLLPSDPPLPQNRFRKRNWMTAPGLAA